MRHRRTTTNSGVACGLADWVSDDTTTVPSEVTCPRCVRVNTSSLKRRLIKEGLLTEGCALCGVTDWLGQPLVLQLDHVNGVNNDNRIDNLRLLCPNCHSQTATFCRRTQAGVAQSAGGSAFK